MTATSFVCVGLSVHCQGIPPLCVPCGGPPPSTCPPEDLRQLEHHTKQTGDNSAVPLQGAEAGAAGSPPFCRSPPLNTPLKTHSRVRSCLAPQVTHHWAQVDWDASGPGPRGVCIYMGIKPLITGFEASDENMSKDCWNITLGERGMGSSVCKET